VINLFPVVTFLDVKERDDKLAKMSAFVEKIKR
jgi:hypothetical protein